MASSSGNSAGAVLSIGGRNFSSEPPIMLVAALGPTHTTSSFRKLGTSTASVTVYTPSGGLAFFAQALRFLPYNSGAATGYISFGYSGATLPYDGATAPTAPITADGNQSGTVITGTITTLTTAVTNDIREWAGLFKCPNATFPYIQAGGGIVGYCQVWGYEA